MFAVCSRCRRSLGQVTRQTVAKLPIPSMSSTKTSSQDSFMGIEAASVARCCCCCCRSWNNRLVATRPSRCIVALVPASLATCLRTFRSSSAIPAWSFGPADSGDNMVFLFLLLLLQVHRVSNNAQSIFDLLNQSTDRSINQRINQRIDARVLLRAFLDRKSYTAQHSSLVEREGY